MSPQKLSLTLALGISVGIIPVLGINTFILLVLALVLRLNVPAIQLVNYSVYVLQLILFVPFLSLGQFIFNGPKIPIDLNNVISLFEINFWETFKVIWQISLLGILVWFIVAVPLSFGIYYFSHQFFAKQLEKHNLKTT